jgi:hypothetical protein
MRLLRVSTGTAISFHPAAALASGGEGRIYPVPQDPSLLAKIYHQPSIERSRKLALMVARPIDDPMAAQGHVSIAWPIDLLRDLDRRGEIVGFVMRRVNDVFPIVNFYNPSGRRQSCPLFNWRYLHQTARNLAAAFAAIHKRGDLVADVNSRNILASPRALITLVDTDSFQVRDPNNGHVFRCPVGTAEYTPPELQNRDLETIDRKVEQDCFGLAIVLFQLLMEGTHPFAGTYLGGGDPPPYEERIRLGHFPYAARNSVPYRPMPIAPPLNILYPLLQHLFVRCFEEGFHNPEARPDAQAWQNALEEAETSLVTCTVNAQHRYAKHSASCPWCERKKLLGGRDPFPSTEGVQRGEHLQPAPGASRRRPQRQPRAINLARIFASRMGGGGTQVVTIRFQTTRHGGGLPPVPVHLPLLAQHPVLAQVHAQQRQAINLVVAIVITIGFGLAALSASDWRVRLLSGAVTLMALFGQRLFQKYPNLLSLAKVGYAGFTLLMAAGVLASFVVRPSFFGSSQAGAMFLLEFLFILGFFSWRATSWRFSFFLKYVIFAGFALIGSFLFTVDLGKVRASPTMEPRPAPQPPPSATPGPYTSPESLRNLGGGSMGLPKVVWSADGKTIARVDSEGTVSLRDARNGLQQLALHPSSATYSLAWSPDGRTLATGSMTGMIELWDPQSGQKQAALQQAGGAKVLAWNPSGSALASVSVVETIELWYGWGASHSTLDRTGRVLSLAWDPEGKILATASWDKTLRLWDTDSRHVTAQTASASTVVTWSPHGNTLATVGAGDGNITLWTMPNERLILKLRTLADSCRCGDFEELAWNPDGTLLASVANQRVVLWDTVSWTEWRQVSVPGEGFIKGIAWSPDGKELAINTNAALFVWDVNR